MPFNFPFRFLLMQCYINSQSRFKPVTLMKFSIIQTLQKSFCKIIS